jgi:hypothetical protein
MFSEVGMEDVQQKREYMTSARILSIHFFKRLRKNTNLTVFHVGAPAPKKRDTALLGNIPLT